MKQIDYFNEPEWISTDECLPDERELCLYVFQEFGCEPRMVVGRLIGEGWFMSREFYGWTGPHWRTPDAKAWIPIPEYISEER